jgi:hypothetical protein
LLIPRPRGPRERFAPERRARATIRRNLGRNGFVPDSGPRRADAHKAKDTGSTLRDRPATAKRRKTAAPRSSRTAAFFARVLTACKLGIDERIRPRTKRKLDAASPNAASITSRSDRVGCAPRSNARHLLASKPV